MLQHYVLDNPYIPHPPHPKPAEFLMLTCKEAGYGGATGGAKSESLFMAALMFVEIPGYNAVIIRRTLQDLKKPEALMTRSHQWLTGKNCRWSSQDKTWYFPTIRDPWTGAQGSSLSFGYMENEEDRFQYQGAAYQFVGLDETTQFTELQYTFMFSRLRGPAAGILSWVPLRMRSATNPGGVGHDWYKARFLADELKKTQGRIPEHAFTTREGRIFVPSKLKDNPSVKAEDYVQNLQELDPITRLQYLEGDWNAKHGQGKFKREWLAGHILDYMPQHWQQGRWVRYWDMASTTPKPGKDPDYMVGLKMGAYEGRFLVADIVRKRVTPAEQETILRMTAQLDGTDCEIYIEEEPGSEGKSLISYYQRKVLNGYSVRPNRATGSKELRANPFSSACEAGNVDLLRGEWLDQYLDELEAFPVGGHDDQVDASSGAHAMLNQATAWVTTIEDEDL